MKLIVIGLVALLAGSSAGICQTTSFDWFSGDKAAGSGKFNYGTFTRNARTGQMVGTGTSFRHANRTGTRGGRILISGNEKTKSFRSITYENNQAYRFDLTVDFKIRTVRTYRATFQADGKTIEMGAIQR